MLSKRDNTFIPINTVTIYVYINFFRQINMQVEDFTIFRQIEMTEYIDHLFDREDKSWYGCPNLKKFGALCDEEMKWVHTFLFWITHPTT